MKQILVVGEDALCCALGLKLVAIAMPGWTVSSAPINTRGVTKLLAALPRVTLANGGVSRYRLRKAPGPGALSTVEAIAQALQVLEAPQSFDALLQPFEALIEGQIAAMGEQTYRRNHG